MVEDQVEMTDVRVEIEEMIAEVAETEVAVVVAITEAVETIEAVAEEGRNE